MQEFLGTSTVLEDLAGTNRVVILTDQAVFLASEGADAGNDEGWRMERIALDQVESVDVRKGSYGYEFVILPKEDPKDSSSTYTTTEFFSNVFNFNVVMFPSTMKRAFLKLADRIRKLSV